MKSSSLIEIQDAISDAVSKLTSTEVKTSVISIADTTSQMASAISGQNTYKLEIELRVGKSYDISSLNDSAPF